MKLGDIEMYHYTECGLSNVQLANGYHIEEVDGEAFYSVENVYELHKVIAKNIVDQTSPLIGEQIRFLRIELNMSQKALGQLLGTAEQTIARWEKQQSVCPKATDAALRAIYLESINEDSQVKLMLEMILELEVGQKMEQIKLEEIDDNWQLAL